MTDTSKHGHADHDHSHHDLPFWKKYIFSQDHKIIGLQYGWTALLFLLYGFGLMLLMRWQFANPGQPLPLIGNWFPESQMIGGVMLPEFFYQLGAMHGTVMVFLGVVPLAVGAFGNYLVPLQIGAPDMAFPKLNMMSYWLYFVGGVIMFASFWVPDGAAQSGWTSYPPLSILAGQGQTVWLVGMAFLINSSLLGSINFITTIVQLRADGLSFDRLPFFVWSQFVTSFLLLLAFPPLMAASVLQLFDRLFGSSFFMPTGLVVNDQVSAVAGGGNPVLWQHLFWFLAHPEVYVLILPAVGIVGEIIACNTRKPLYNYKALVYSAIFVGFMSFVVWAHHMFLTNMGTTMNTFFQVTTMIISIPSVIILTVLVLSLWGGSIRFNTPMLFAVAFLPMFGLGGLTGLPLGLAATDIHLHDTNYVIGHFHYVVAPGTIFALFAGIYHWFPKMTGRKMNETLGKIHFFFSLILMNCIFAPMLIQGLIGVLRRMYDPMQYAHAQPAQPLNVFISISAGLLAIAQIPFIVNFFWSLFAGQKVEENPWQATTMEWTAPSPPSHGNFVTPPQAHRGPYEYSAPGCKKDFWPQAMKETN